MIRVEIYEEKHLDAIVRFWNSNLKTHRNFIQLTPELFQQRIAGKQEFDPKNYLIAFYKDLAGLIHFGTLSPELSRNFYSSDRVGYIGFICTDKDHRRKGIGSRLWNEAMTQLGGCAKIIVDGQCLNGYYGNIEGPCTPFFGTAEGISVPWEDEETRTFFKKRGYLPRYQGTTLELSEPFQITEIEKTLLERFHNEVLEVLRTSDFVPNVGVAISNHHPLIKKYIFESICVTKKGVVVAQVTYYPMMELTLGKYAIYSVFVDDKERGKGLGSDLLKLAIMRMGDCGAKSIEVITLRGVEKDAITFYSKLGFKPVANWAIY